VTLFLKRQCDRTLGATHTDFIYTSARTCRNFADYSQNVYAAIAEDKTDAQWTALNAHHNLQVAAVPARATAGTVGRSDDCLPFYHASTAAATNPYKSIQPGWKATLGWAGQYWNVATVQVRKTSLSQMLARACYANPQTAPDITVMVSSSRPAPPRPVSSRFVRTGHAAGRRRRGRPRRVLLLRQGQGRAHDLGLQGALLSFPFLSSPLLSSPLLSSPLLSSPLLFLSSPFLYFAFI
jgi:hypothetical protein